MMSHAARMLEKAGGSRQGGFRYAPDEEQPPDL